jgi:hypothetical protein
MNTLVVMISTVPFAPNDLLAYRAAEELMRLGHRVLVSPWDWGDRNAPEYEEVRKMGALLAMGGRHERPDNFFLRQLEKIRDRIEDPRTEWQFADEFRPDAIVVSDPATYQSGARRLALARVKGFNWSPRRSRRASSPVTDRKFGAALIGSPSSTSKDTHRQLEQLARAISS